MVVTAFRYRIAPPPPAGGRRDVSPYYSGVKPRLQDAGPLCRKKKRRPQAALIMDRFTP